MTLSSEKFIICDIIARIKSVKSIKSDLELARVLGLSRTALAERKRRGSIPYREIFILADKEGVSLDWLLRGEGPKYRYEKKHAEKDEGAVKQPPPPKCGVADLELEHLVNQLNRIYLLGDSNAKSKLRILLAALDPGEP
jgi:transcriptional regulator with XRE-family HTH domain